MGARILIIDDAAESRLLLSGLLAKRGHQIDEVDEGAAALRMIESTRYDLILLDMVLPGMDGISILREVRLKKSRRDLPVIVVSSLDESDQIVEAFQAGANDYITKPLNLPVALARIQKELPEKPDQKGPSAATGASFQEGETYEIGFLHIKILLHPGLRSMTEGAEISAMLDRIFQTLTDAALRYGVSVWTRRDDNAIFAAPAENMTSIVLAGMEMTSLVRLYNLVNENPPHWITASAGISTGPTVYHTDTNSIYSDALNQSVHLVKHAEGHTGLRISEAVFTKISPPARKYFRVLPSDSDAYTFHFR